MKCTARYKSGKLLGEQCRSKTACRFRNADGSYVYLCGIHNHQYRRQNISKIKRRERQLVEQCNPDGTSDLFSRKNIGTMYPNQITAAKNVVSKFVTGKKMILLKSPMQAGKTGTLQYTIKHAICRIPDIIPFIIIPINDNEILEQARSDFVSTDIIKDEHLFGASHLRCVNFLKDELLKYHDKHKLLIIDESHIACDNDGLLDKFLQAAGIYLNGDTIPDDVYVLTVSATAMAETALLTYNEMRQKKQLVVLKPGRNYFGVNEMINLNRIRKAWKLSSDKSISDFTDEINLFVHLHEYMLIRCHKKTIIDKVKSAFKHRYGDNINIIEYDRHNPINNINTILAQVPEKPTAILLANRLRASKRIITKNVSMCFGWSDNLVALMQGLIGRGCGYNKQQDHTIFYTNIDLIKIYRTWYKNNFYVFGTPNNKHVTNGVNKSSLSWKSNVPIMLELDDHAKNMINALGNNVRNYRYGNISLHLGFLWQTQQPVLARIYSNPIKSNGVSVINPGFSAESTVAKFWSAPYDAYEHHREIIGFETKQIQQNKKSGWYMYINRQTMECLVCYTKRQNPVKKPTVSDTCVYKPRGALTRVPLVTITNRII